MEQVYLGKKIAELRKSKEMTQEALAKLLGVTNQAVSKWESDSCYPDITLLPELAKVLGTSLDGLFGLKTERDPAPHRTEYSYNGLPWPDDDNLRAECFIGHRLEDYADMRKKNQSLGSLFTSKASVADRASVQLSFSGSVGNISSEFAVNCTDCVISGNVTAGDSVQCGDVGGSIGAGDGVKCGSVGGNVKAGDFVRCGDVSGSVTAGDYVQCGSIGGSVISSDGVRIKA